MQRGGAWKGCICKSNTSNGLQPQLSQEKGQQQPGPAAAPLQQPQPRTLDCLRCVSGGGPPAAAPPKLAFPPSACSGRMQWVSGRVWVGAWASTQATAGSVRWAFVVRAARLHICMPAPQARRNAQLSPPPTPPTCAACCWYASCCRILLARWCMVWRKKPAVT